MSSCRHLANLRIRWHIPYPQHRFVITRTSRAQFNRPRYFSSSQSLRRAPNHYAVLGVSRDASAAAIQQAFLRESLKKHPDVNKTPNARADFQAVLEAKEVLSDASKRGTYDVVWVRENAGWIGAEKLRKQREKQQEEEREREGRKLAKQMEEKQRREKEEAEKRARDRERQQAASRAANDRGAQRIAELKVKRAAHREFQEKIKAAKERKGREDSRWETRAQKKQQESKLEREARAKADKEAKTENQK